MSNSCVELATGTVAATQGRIGAASLACVWLESSPGPRGEARRGDAAHKVLMLHGPPHCPRFYGQLERQNREHGEWLRETQMDLPEACETMLALFNELIPRRSLEWRTSSEAWRSRKAVVVDRAELAAEAAERVKKPQEQASRVAYPWKLERQAIEAALINRGLLKLNKGGWC